MIPWSLQPNDQLTADFWQDDIKNSRQYVPFRELDLEDKCQVIHGC